MREILILEQDLLSLKDALVQKNERKENLQSFPDNQPRDILGDSIRNLCFGDIKIDDMTVRFEKDYGIWNLEYKIGFSWQRLFDYWQMDRFISDKEDIT